MEMFSEYITTGFALVRDVLMTGSQGPSYIININVSFLCIYFLNSSKKIICVIY